MSADVTEHALDRQKTANRREALTYALFAAFVLLIMAFGIIVWFMASGSESVDLGAVSDFPANTPVVQDLVLRDKSTLKVWIVHAQSTWYVFDARTPPEGFLVSVCFFQWQPVTGRFEDPCSGAKFNMSGEFVDPYSYFAGTKVQNLDHYSVTTSDGHLWIDPTRIIHAQPFVAPGE